MAPVIALIISTISKRMRNSSRDAQKAMGDITQVIEESVGAHKVVKCLGGQQYEGQRFSEQNNWMRRHAMKQAAAGAANVPIVQIVAAVALAAVVYLATLQSNADEITVGGVVSFIMAMLMLTAPLKRLTGVSEYLQRGLAAAESVFALLDTEGEADSGTKTIGRVRGELQFDHVQFAYGAGGCITLDGHDINDLTLASLRANIALVSQEVVLFNDTVTANIANGQMREVSEAEIIGAAQAAHAIEFIREWPGGLNTPV